MKKSITGWLAIFACLLQTMEGCYKEDVSFQEHENTLINKPYVVGSPHIYVSGKGDSASLLLSNSAIISGLYFKYGSVVAIRECDSYATFEPKSDVVFNPTDYQVSHWGNSNNKQTDIRAGYVPSYSDEDYFNSYQDERLKNVSSSAYHTVENLKLGKGDPCKLVGYTQGQIKKMLEKRLLPDNKTWRLPTQNDDNDPYNRSSLTPEDVTLPSMGFRSYSSGGVFYQKSFGIYWFSTVIDDGQGFSLYVDSSVADLQNNSIYSVGLSVRCVAQSKD